MCVYWWTKLIGYLQNWFETPLHSLHVRQVLEGVQESATIDPLWRSRFVRQNSSLICNLTLFSIRVLYHCSLCAFVAGLSGWLLGCVSVCAWDNCSCTRETLTMYSSTTAYQKNTDDKHWLTLTSSFNWYTLVLMEMWKLELSVTLEWVWTTKTLCTS